MAPRSGSGLPLARPRIPPTLARRIDRLAFGAHLFHRWAHHPLCERYAGELVRIGRRARVCRGCAMSAIGCVVGGVAGVALGVAPWIAFAIAASFTALLVPTLLRPRRRGPRARTSKWITRTAPTMAWAFSIGAGVRAPVYAIATLGLIALCTALYRRRGPDRSPCATCPERDAQPCSGFAPMILRERAFQRLSAKWLRGAGL
jgi:hypothetical protein